MYPRIYRPVTIVVVSWQSVASTSNTRQTHTEYPDSHKIMKIDAKFDSGAIIVKDISNEDGVQAATLEIAHDAPHAGKP